MANRPTIRQTNMRTLVRILEGEEKRVPAYIFSSGKVKTERPNHYPARSS